MKRTDWEILDKAARTLRIHGYESDAARLGRIIASEQEKWAKYDQGYDYVIAFGELKSRRRSVARARQATAFAKWYVKSDWDDPAAAFTEWRKLQQRSLTS